MSRTTSKTDELRAIKTLTHNMLDGIDYMLANPGWTPQGIADACGLHYMTVYRWLHSPLFMEAYRNRVDEKWANAITSAQIKLIERVNDNDWNAIKYILDSAGYNAPQKVEVNSSNKITITIDNEDE